eukprot:CAMPEP_0184291984 /NCGR_PEP_ID=MMETSP1049-20130417/3845_1 /TAXON_ID=77928 /ORGANISM="Proteomonas sulcata, Strain CCMP704" /LENGTH=218 /DNA_ID=CAMNT_0026599581 /DNA_START=1 /DNA_END=657 /DNA_ORIENTATION=-
MGAGFASYQNLGNILPANHPVLRNRLVLGVDPGNAVQDILRAREETSGNAANMWPKDKQDIKLTLEKFDPLQIEWELSSIGGRSDDQVIVMQPGYEYLLEALLQIRPVYAEDVWENGKIERWERQVVSTAASRTPLTDPREAHQVIVRYHLQYDPLIRAQTFRKSYTMHDFAKALGALAGYFVFGVMILNCLFRIKLRQNVPMQAAPGATDMVEYTSK